MHYGEEIKFLFLNDLLAYRFLSLWQEVPAMWILLITNRNCLRKMESKLILLEFVQILESLIIDETFIKYGECGQYVSSLFPNIAKHVDDFAFIHSMHTEGVMVHRHYLCIPEPPTWVMGSWISYGLNEIKISLVLLRSICKQGWPKIIAMLFYHPFIRVRFGRWKCKRSQNKKHR